MSNAAKYSNNKENINSEKIISQNKLINHDNTHKEKLNDSIKSITPEKILLDTVVTMTVELGQSKIKIRDFLRLSLGDMLILNKSIKEPLDIFINGHLIASGEIVVLEKKYGLRIINIKNSLKTI